MGSSSTPTTNTKTDSPIDRALNQSANASFVAREAQDAKKSDDKSTATDMTELTINTIRTLAMDAVQKANSGHPGTPMALAPVMYVLWREVLRFDPDDAIWPNRDRFVLSVGHASMLLYSALFLSQTKAVNEKYERLGEVSVSLDDIKKFRQLHSKCPGHPEYRITSGVETTTGPLGQGVANSVGMAIAERWQAERFGKDVFDYRVYALCGDGDLMEGVSAEAASIAGHLKLSNLCWIYDSNHITIEGKTDLAFTEHVGERFKSYGWNVVDVADANDLSAIRAAFKAAQGTKDRPTLIIVHSHIGFGSSKQDSREAHGEPLGEDVVKATKKFYGWPENAQFLVPDGVIEHFRGAMMKRGHEANLAWKKSFEAFAKKSPSLAKEVEQMQRRDLPDGWETALPTFETDAAGIASRDSSGKVLNALAQKIPWLLGGAADLSPSTKTDLKFDGAGSFEADSYGGRNFHFGIREHAMGSIVNGMALSKLRPYGATFLIFSDYERPPIRLSAIMEIPSVHIFTHDSIGVGEDGPTHQPIEQLASLRAIPGLVVLRPADANEVTEAWRSILSLKHQPVALVLTRQKLPTIDRKKYAPASGAARGGYILAGGETPPDVILIGTGSEISLCLEAHEKLVAKGIKSRVVSLPSWEIFEKQDEAYRETVLPQKVTARVSVEQAATFGWDRFVGSEGAKIGMTTFGASAPLKDLLGYFGFTVDKVVAAADAQIARAKKKS